MQVKAKHDRKVMYASLLVWAALHLPSHSIGQAKFDMIIKNWPLERAVDSIKRRSGISAYADYGLLTQRQRVNLSLKGVTGLAALQQCLEPFGLIIEGDAPNYFIKRRAVVLSKRNVSASLPDSATIPISVTNEAGEALSGATIKIIQTGVVYTTDSDGICRVPVPVRNLKADISFAGMTSQEADLSGRDMIHIVLEANPQYLDEKTVSRYFDTNPKTRTGNISTVTGEMIAMQPVNDPIAALQGRVPGLTVIQSSGVPGAQYQILIRGQGSIANGNSPLFVIDGVPYVANVNLSNIPSGSAAGSLSPFSSINPGDIESIEILKDADATAIYGSRGANGVILITTRKVRSVKGHINVRVFSGWSKVTRILHTMNTPEYVSMRNEALSNDGLKANAVNAPDLTQLDTTRSTNWPKALTGGTAYFTTAQISAYGTHAKTNYQTGASWTNETSVFPDHSDHLRGTMRGSLDHAFNKKLTLQLSGLIGLDRNNQGITDLSKSQFFIPNGPTRDQLFDAAGEPIFWDNGVYYNNPFSFTRQYYQANTRNMLGSAVTDYHPLSGLDLKSFVSFSLLDVQEDSGIPIKSQDAASNPTGSSYTATTVFSGWSVTQEGEYKRQKGLLHFSIMAGFTMQGQRNTVSSLSATGFTSDATLSQPAAAASLSANKEISDYHYTAVYSKVNLYWDDRYIINFTGRRDGSSRFGPGKQYGKFGAIGAAWVFKKTADSPLRWISFGKLRGSLGVTGNDQIGDYQYLAAWSGTTGGLYQGVRGFYTIRPENPTLRWEKMGKAEIGIELSFLKEKISFSVNYYRHRSTDQLLPTLLPLQTGFNVTLKNFPAVVINSGYELGLETINVKKKDVQWTSSLNISFPRNRLASFPGLENSPYAGSLVVGKSIYVLRALTLLGVDPVTGLWKYYDRNNDGQITDVDRGVCGTYGLVYYGGFQHTVRYKKWRIDLHMEFRKQFSKNYMTELYNYNAPGMMAPGQYSNASTAAASRWSASGSRGTYQRLTTLSTSDAGKAITNYGISDAAITDGSFVRCKTMSISYYLPDPVLKRFGMSEGRVYFESQNMFTITPYKGVDPEIASAYILPPMSTLAFGVQFMIK